MNIRITSQPPTNSNEAVCEMHEKRVYATKEKPLLVFVIPINHISVNAKIMCCDCADFVRKHKPKMKLWPITELTEEAIRDAVEKHLVYTTGF